MKGLKSLLGVVMIGLVLVSCTTEESIEGDSAKNETDSTKKEIKKVRIYAGIPGRSSEPFYNWEEGNEKPVGIEPRLIEYILGQLDIPYEFVHDYAFEEKGDERINVLKMDRADIAIQGITITDERKQSVLFTEPYYLDGLGVMVRNNSNLTELEDLKGKKVFAYRFSTTYKWAKENLKESKIISQEDFGMHPTKLLMKGKIDAYLDDYGTLKRTKGYKGQTRLFQKKYTEEQYGIAVSEKNPELLEKINGVIIKMRESGRLKDFVKGFER